MKLQGCSIKAAWIPEKGGLILISYTSMRITLLKVMELTWYKYGMR